MPSKDGRSSISVFEALPAGSAAADVEGTIIDTKGADKVTLLVSKDTGQAFEFGIISGNDPALADGADEVAKYVLTDVTDDDTASTVTIASGEKTGKIGYIGVKRYIRLHRIGGSAVDAAAVAVLDCLAQEPAPNHN